MGSVLVLRLHLRGEARGLVDSLAESPKLRVVFAKCHLVWDPVCAGSAVIGQSQSSEEVTFEPRPEGGESPLVPMPQAERTVCANILQGKSQTLNLFKVQGKPLKGFGSGMTYLCLQSRRLPGETSDGRGGSEERKQGMSSYEDQPLLLSAGVTGLGGSRRTGGSLSSPCLHTPAQVPQPSPSA